MRSEVAAGIHVAQILLALTVSSCDLSYVNSEAPFCSKSDCGGNRVQLSGELPISGKLPLYVKVTTCADEDCTTDDASLRGRFVYHSSDSGRWIATNACDHLYDNAWCEPKAQWQVLVRFGLSSTDAAAQPERYSVRVEDEGGNVLVDRAWDADFDTVTPRDCGEHEGEVSCLHFDATW